MMSGLRNTCVSQKNEVLKFCVVRENIVVKLFNLLDNKVSDSDIRVIRMGSLVELQPLVLPENDVGIRILSSEGSVLDDKVWVGQTDALVSVLPDLWPAFQGINSPFHRLFMAQEKELCVELSKVQVGHMISLLPEDFDNESTVKPEIAIVRYIGSVPEIGPGHYFGLELSAFSTQGINDGSVYGKRYFTCAKNGVFVPLHRLRPCSRETPLQLRNLYSRPLKYGEVFSDCKDTSFLFYSSMPSNEKRTQHHDGGNADSVSYTTTLVLHLKEKDNMPKSLSQKVERTEKLIDLDPSGNNSDVTNSLLKPGDRVVWFNDSEPEFGVVRWMDDSDLVGVECDNAVGSGTGEYNKRQLFKTAMNHAAFIPLISLIKAEDFFSKPADHVKKNVRNIKLIENCNNSKVSRTRSATTRGLETHVESMWNAPLVDFSDAPDGTANNYSKEKHEDNLCRSEYVFSEHNIDSIPKRIDNANKRIAKDSHNNNSVRKASSTVNNYTAGEVNSRESLINESYPSSRQVVGDRHMKNNSEMRTKHSYSQDVLPHNGIDMCDLPSDMWPSVIETSKMKVRDDKLHKSFGFNGKPAKSNNISDSLLEIVGESLLPAQTKSTEFQDNLLSTSPSVSSDGSGCYENPDSPNHTLQSDLDIGSVVEVTINGLPRYGVIRWIGIVPEDAKGRKVAGIEMEEEQAGCSDGTFNSRRYFVCNPRKAMFLTLSQCRKDGRFQDVHPSTNESKSKSFGQMGGCPVIPGVVCPIDWKEDGEVVCGKFRGIQGHHNSCYLDATLFSMFTFTSVFDSLLFRPPTENDVAQYDEVQRVLREEIVNPLRQNLYVRADRVMKLRTLLENLSSVTGLTSEEKDPEEFLTSLVAQILRAEPFLKLSSGQEAYHYQLFVEKDEQLVLPSVQELFDQSFLTSDIKLKEVPSCLIIQMPRFGKSFKMYPRILPSQLLDVTDIIEDSPRQCIVCGKLAEYECKECFGQCGSGLESIAFCGSCLDTAHSHQRRSRHGWRRLSVPVEFSILQDHCHIPRLCMELFAVVCIETSHYVAFVKCGSGSDAPWCFFDSMADRKGEQNGYNIPEMVLCPKLPYWLSKEGARSLQEIKDDRLLPEHAKRLLCDAYMCMYQSPDVMMYR